MLFYCHHLNVITTSVYVAILLGYANVSFQMYRNHGEMRAYDGGAVTLPRFGCICDKSPTFSAITHCTYFILFQPAKAHHH